MHYEKCNHKNLILEADFTDPIFCAGCNSNFELVEFPIPEELEKEIFNWSMEYSNIYELIQSGDKDVNRMIQDYNDLGSSLTDKLRIALTGNISSIVYRPVMTCHMKLEGK